MMQSDARKAGDPAPQVSDAYLLGKPAGGWRRRVFNVVFESDTRAGRIFDVILIAAILLSIAAVLADSMANVALRHGKLLTALEWIFTILFTLEYIARLSCVERPMRYVLSFYGVVDLIAILPTYLAVFFPEAALLIDVRILRLMRIMRIFKLTAYLTEYQLLADAMAASGRKIMVFLSVVVMVVLIIATLMYVIEGPKNGFTSIPFAIYWAISTISTVGYGDVVPRTDVGRALASIMMLIGWGILAVPTGIVTAEMTARKFQGSRGPHKSCRECGSLDHEEDAGYCRLCGAKLETG